MYSYKTCDKSFEYAVEGEIKVIPDCAIFPVYITVKTMSNTEAIATAQKVFTEITDDSQKLSSKVSVGMGSFHEKHGTKIVSKVFGKKDTDYIQTTISFYLHLQLEQEEFWQRAEKVSEILDFVRKIEQRYKGKEDISLRSENVSFYLNNKEKYREQLIDTIYQRLMTMANVIAAKENKIAKVKEIVLDQAIDCEVLNMSSAVLKMKSHFEIVFADVDA